MSTGGLSMGADDFNTNLEFDRAKYGYVGGCSLTGGGTNGRPIAYRPVPAGTPPGARHGRRRLRSGTTVR